MGSGCFKPPSAPTQLDLCSLDAIYEEIRELSPPSSSSYQSQVQVYQEIQQRIGQRGKLKKLCDYLCSHRHRISDTVMHSYRLVYQSKNSLYKYVGIIVMDAMLNIGPKAKDRAKNKSALIESSIGEHSSSRAVTLHSTFRESGAQNLVENEKEKSEQEGTKLQTNTSEHFSHDLSSPKLQSIYFNLITLLIQQNDLLYKLSLENMIKYCTLYQEPTGASLASRFSNKTQVLEVMKVIYYHIQVGNQLEVSLKCYKAMLAKVQDGYFAANVECLSGLFDLWMGMNEVGGGGFHEGISSKSINVEENTLSAQQLSQLVVDIIQVFLCRSIDDYQNSHVIEEVLKVMDRYKFRKTTKIENILLDALDTNELKSQFNKSFIIHLLSYIGFPESCARDGNLDSGINFMKQESRISEEGEDALANMPPLERQWVECYKISMPSAYVRNYKNIRDPECKLNSIPKISKWLYDYSLVDIEDLLTYSGLCLLNAFIFNLYSQEKTIKDKTIIEFTSFLNKLSEYERKTAHQKDHREVRHENHLKMQAGDLILAEIEENRVSEDGVRFTLFSIWDVCLESEKELAIDESHAHLIPSLNFVYCFENNLKLIKMMGKVLDRLNKDSLRIHLGRICGFFDSVYREIVGGFSNGSHKITLIQEFAVSFATGPRAIYKGVYAAFLEKLTSSSRNEKHQVPQTCIFFIDYLSTIVAKMLGLGIANPNIEAYREKISKSKEAQQIGLLEQYSMDRMPMQLEIPHREQLDLYRESVEHFKVAPNGDYDMGATASVLWKGAQSLLERSLSGDSIHTKADKDLEDVLDIIRF